MGAQTMLRASDVDIAEGYVGERPTLLVGLVADALALYLCNGSALL